MSYEVLYRKYRPQSLKDLCGQDHIAQSLSNSAKSKKFAHAYLFTGWHGAGKTSTARIMAMMLNCEQGVTDNPCGKCESCASILNGSAVDILEIDAASNRGIGEIKDIQKNLSLSPNHLRYKMIILDEAHQLTPQAANALLKTLEEPPSHVYFVLCTTEPKAILSTIHSRCERYDFKKITNRHICDRLKTISQAENIQIDDESLQIIAKYSNGSLRNAIANLDQIWKTNPDKITQDRARESLGASKEGACRELINAIGEMKAAHSIKIVNELLSSGVKPDALLGEITSYLRNLAVTLASPSNDPNVLEISDVEYHQLREQARNLKMRTIIGLFDVFSKSQEGMEFNINPQFILEMALFKSIIVVKKSQE